MTVFLIQTVHREVIHDFAFTLAEAVRYHKWYYGKDCLYDYVYSETCECPEDIPLKDIVPVGSVEFVQEYIRKHYGIENVKPINIPQSLNKPEYTKRWMECRVVDEPVKSNYKWPVFIKDNNKLKGFAGIVRPGEAIEVGYWLFSEIVEIESEWRAFVYKEELVGLKNYLGDFAMVPNVEQLKRMIADYKDSPTAYTLDVGVSGERGTFIIEVHDFSSCGLYGFADLRLIPKMMSVGYREMLKRTRAE